MMYVDLEGLNEHETIYICWSGGCDSTALLYCVASKYKNHDVVAITLSDEYNSSEKADNIAREKLKKRFDKLAEQDVLSPIIFRTIEFNESAVNAGGLVQPAQWALLANTFLDTNSSILFGYIREDDFWHYKQQFCGILDNLFSMRCVDTGNYRCKYYFPLEWINKEEIIKYLKEKNLFQYCSYCEQPTGKNRNMPCKACHSCKSVQHVLRDIEESEK